MYMFECRNVGMLECWNFEISYGMSTRVFYN